MKQSINEIKRMQRIAGILKENTQSSEDISYKMFSDQIYQSWVDDMWEYLEKYKPGFTEQDVIELLKDAQVSLEEEVNNNIQTYFKPETL